MPTPGLSILTAAIAALATTAAAHAQALPRAHAHNDYEHTRPLHDALDHGFQSVEADVHLVDGKLLVAHDREDCARERTLRSLYLEPLSERVAANRGRVHADGPLEFQLLVDFKTGGEATYRALAAELTDFRAMLTRFDGGRREPGAVLVVLSGAAPDDVVLADDGRLCALDGWFDDVERGGTANEYPLLSRSWRSEFTWLGDGPMPSEERAKLDDFVRRAHAAGRRLRFWAVPNLARVWRVQLEAGVDWLNLDDLPGARRFLTGDGQDLWARAALDRLLDDRHGDPAATARLAARLTEDGRDPAEVEQLLRRGRVRHAPPELPAGKILGGLPLACEHVDYQTTFLLYLPKGFDPTATTALVVIGHGGNGAMDAGYAQRAAAGGLAPWRPVADRRGWILAAPLTERGWGSIGNSIVLSLISKLKRWYPIDPDRVYMTGHSMGGHLTWRTGLTMADRFAALSPMSGGYDYVERGNMGRLWNVPGYATFGEREPYGIADHNRRMRGWFAEHGYDWEVVEKPGGHEIFGDELPKVAEFFAARPRDRHRKIVYAQANATGVWTDPGSNPRWGTEHTWNPDRPIHQTMSHWLRLAPRADLPAGTAQEALATVDREANRIELTTSEVRAAELLLHPELVDFDRALEVIANGETVFRGEVRPDLVTLLDEARRFDDRGRTPHARIEIAIASDRAVPVPGSH